MSRRVRLWVIVGIMLACIATGWAIVLRENSLAHTHALDVALERSRARAVVLREFVDSAFSFVGLSLRQFDVRPDISGIVLPSDAALIQEVLRRTIRVVPIFFGLAITNAAGQVIISTREDTTVYGNIASRPFFTGHRDNTSPDLLVSRPLRLRFTNQISIPVSMRLEGDDGRFAGVIVGNVRPDYFDVFLRSLAIDTAAIVLNDGAILARVVANATPGLFPTDPGDQIDLRSEFIQRWHEETAGTYVGRSPFGGETQAASYSSLKSIAGAAYIGIDLERELAPSRLEARNRIAVGIALTILAGLLTAVMVAGALRDEHAAGELRAARDAAEAARRRAEEADLNKSNFLAHAGHELRTPLNAIIGFSEVLAAEALGPLGEPRYREYSGYIHDSGQHLLGVVNNILDLAQVSAGRWQVRKDRFALDEVLDEIWRIITPLAAARSVKLERNIATGLPELVTERRVVRQILLNLASNAVKFTMAGGRAMVVAAPATDGGLILRISDTGIGIDPAIIDQVAQPFSNFSHVVARTQGGTGLGLPLCRVFVELLGGTMTIHSRVNEGTTVTVMLPASCLVPAQVETEAATGQVRTAS